MKKERLTSAATIFTIIASIITLITVVFGFLIPLYIRHKFNVDTSKACSIGIIGGADGPTTIFISSQSSAHPIAVIFASLTIVGIVYLITAKKKMK